MESVIREFREDDLPEIVEFGLEAFRPVFASFEEHYGTDLFNRLRPDWENAQKDVIRSYCTNEDNETWVSEIGGALSGFVVLWANEATGLGQIGLLAVHPEFQNRGVGTQLNEHAVARLRDAGMAWVIVGTGDDAGHAPARRSYEKAGFSALSIQPHQMVRRL